MGKARTARDPARYKGLPKDQKLMEVWETALQRTVKLTIDDRAAYQQLRHKLYQLRLILWAEEHPLYQTIQHFTISTAKIGENTFTITISPGNEHITKALKNAGFMSAEVDDDFLNPEK